MATSSQLTLQSPSKINVFLEVPGKRPDGFHELETIMLRTNLCDSLTFDTAAGGDISLHLDSTSTTADPHTFPLDASNLIVRSAVALQEATGCPLGASIRVRKNIPAEAGLAGGSSNAATTLRGLNRLWKLNLATNRLHTIAATLGSDINFFVEDCRAAVCRGRGEQVTPVPLSGEFHVVAVRPVTGNSTPEVFAALEPIQEQRDSSAVLLALATGDVEALGQAAFNRLTNAARAVNSEMADVMKELATITERAVCMSGSGSTCFVFADSASHATALTDTIRKCLRSDISFLQPLKV